MEKAKKGGEKGPMTVNAGKKIFSHNPKEGGKANKREEEPNSSSRVKGNRRSARPERQDLAEKGVGHIGGKKDAALVPTWFQGGKRGGGSGDRKKKQFVTLVLGDAAEDVEAST